jgi:hypothetical protein
MLANGLGLRGRSCGIKWGVPAMFNEDDVRTLVAYIRSIASDCFDLRAVERLRSLADQIEQKGRESKAVPTKNDNSEGRANITPV